MTSNEVQTVINDLGWKILEFEKERNKVVNMHRQQNSGMSAERHNITMIAKKRQFRDLYQEKYQKKCLSKIRFTSARMATGIACLFE